MHAEFMQQSCCDAERHLCMVTFKVCQDSNQLLYMYEAVLTAAGPAVAAGCCMVSSFYRVALPSAGGFCQLPLQMLVAAGH